MPRSPIVSLAIVALLAAPAPASAEPAGMPLWTLCSSPTMDYCASFWTYEVEFLGDPSGGYVARWHSTFSLFGNGYAGYTGGFYAQTFANFLGGCRIGLFGAVSVNGPGDYEIGDSSGGCVDTPALSSIRDMSLLHFTLGSSGATPCTPGVSCYEVPEPSSLLLLASGLLGVVGVRSRRRRAA